MSDKISATLQDITLLGSEVVQSSERLVEIEDKADDVNAALKKIKTGTQHQTLEVNDVVLKASDMENNFAALREQSKVLLHNVEKTIESEKAGADCISELEKQNTKNTQLLADSYEKIVALNEQSKEISGIINTIANISSETSLLALNASIEAARAGEQGRGFSVVAESIGKLARDSSEATSNIDTIINDLCHNIEGVVSDVETINRVINGQSAAVLKVQHTFEDFKILAENTDTAMDGIDALVNEMNEISQSMVEAVQKISQISNETDSLTDVVGAELEQQLKAIQYVSQRVHELSKVTK